ncbi:hypothetical protein SAMN04488132_10494 [Sediminibacterium ginsengisoli]|uniref:O-antigen ligase n=1 Tax=Sediminibacterium ginsengisoli TaxID=413434 RepID=A0A1T4N587_9BACT|nr:hypothetical protein SAMN04488132_10494 [Sediminibacterium ginsengisoli]
MMLELPIKTKLTNLNKDSYLYVFLIGLFLSLIFQTRSTIPALYYPSSLVALAIICSVFFLPPRLLIYPLFLLIICMPDLTQTFEEIEELGVVSVASPWQFSFSILSPAFFVFGSLLVITIRLFSFPIAKSDRSILVFFFIVSTIVSFIFGFFQESFSRFVADAKIPMFFCIGLIIFGNYYKRYPSELLISCQVFILLAAGNYSVDIFKFFFLRSEGIEKVSYSSLSLDSAKGLITIFSFWAIAGLIKGKNIIVNIVLVLLTLYVLLAYQTRWLIITFVLGLLVIAFAVGFKNAMIVLTSIVLLFCITIPIIIKVAPEVWETAMFRLSFIGNLTSGSSLEDVEIVRAGSIYNSMNLLFERKAFLTGMGYGSWYTDNYFPMPNLTTAAFDEDALNMGKYYRVHDFLFNFLFKFGIIGTGIYISCYLKPIRRLWKLKKQILADSRYNFVFIAIIGLCPMVITYMWFTGKGLLFGALFVVISREWARVFKEKITTREA